MPNDGALSLHVLSMGLMPYEACLELQLTLHAEVVAARRGPTLILVEHPPVLTLGKHADPAHLLFGREAFAASGVAVVGTDRGGQVTAHMPGQLVAYPILRLADLGLSPRSYVRVLEDSVIETLRHFGVEAAIDPDHPGVWVGLDKICALGVRVKDRATLHGLALNVDNALDLFQQIVPCGLHGRGVIKLASLLGRQVTTAQVAPVLTEALARRLNLTIPAIRSVASLQWGDGVFTI